MRQLDIEAAVFFVGLICAFLAFLLFAPLSIDQKQNIQVTAQQEMQQPDENKKTFDYSEPSPPVPPYMMPHPKLKP